MKNWITEFLLILAFSRRTLIAIILGVISFFVVNIFGYFILKDFQFSGVLQPLSESVGNLIGNRYDRVAWGSLIGFWVLAIQFYKKDKKRFHRIF